jgi:S-layer homology domain
MPRYRLLTLLLLTALLTYALITSARPLAASTPSATPSSTLTATPPPNYTITPTPCPNPYVDINGNVFFYAIVYLQCNRFHEVYSTHYNPGGPATRGQIAKEVVLDFGTPLYTPTTQDFVDVPPSYFAYVFIESGFHAGILSGFDPATCTAYGLGSPCYLPNITVSRGQLTRLVINAGNYQLYTPPGGQDFTDVPPSNVFYVSVETAYHNAIINGYPGHLFLPNANIRRDEMAGVVYAGIINRP